MFFVNQILKQILKHCPFIIEHREVQGTMVLHGARTGHFPKKSKTIAVLCTTNKGFFHQVFLFFCQFLWDLNNNFQE